MTALRRRWGTAFMAGAAALTLAACTTGGTSDAPSPAGNAVSSTESSSRPAPKPPAKVTVAPANGAKDVNPLSPITVTSEGDIAAITVKNDQGKVVKGALDAKKRTWKSAEVLGYGRTYTVTTSAVNVEKRTHTSTSTFKTVVPDNFTMPYLNTSGGVSIEQGGTYGVGMVIVAHFDEPIPDKKAAEQLLTVSTSPKVTGSWYWATDQNAHWRPQKYWPSGTEVSVSAKVYGKTFGSGLWGQADVSTNFRIGQSRVTIADDNTKQVQVFVDGRLVRTMPTSFGKGGYYTPPKTKTNPNPTTVHYWTQPGTYTVLDRARKIVMDSSTYGVPKGSPEYYKTDVEYATRISNDGIYLHSAPWSVWAQGSSNQSHGCLNLSPENAIWFYETAQRGDPVEVRNTGGPALQLWQNGDWSVPWSTWVAGSALN